MNDLVQKLRRDPSSASIAEAIERAVMTGRLQPGEALPPIRNLARDLDVSPTTVASGYRTLRDRCVIVTAGRGGTRINPRTPVMLRAGTPKKAEIKNLADSHPDVALLPDLAAASRAATPHQRQYNDCEDSKRLMEIATRRFIGDGIRVEGLGLCHGGMDGVHRALIEHLRTGDKVAVEDPCAWATLDLFQLEGWLPSPVEIDDSGMKPNALERALREGARAVLITPRAQNPMGASLDESRARELRRVLDKFEDVLVVEDDYGADLVSTPSLSTCDGRKGPWVIERSYAKSHGPDVRLGVLNGDADTIRRIRLRMLLTGRWVSRILQDLVVALLESDQSVRAVDHARRVYDARRETFIRCLGERGITGRGRSGLNVWIPVSTPETPIVREMLARGWAISGGDLCRLESSRAVRVTTSNLPVEDAPRVAQDLAESMGLPANGAAAPVDRASTVLAPSFP